MDAIALGERLHRRALCVDRRFASADSGLTTTLMRLRIDSKGLR